jgi:hypothetical protein
MNPPKTPMWMLRPVKEETLDGIKNKFLVKARQEFEAGDQTVILRCMFLCMWLEIEPPDWLRDAFCDRAGGSTKFKTWDDAFGPPMPKGTKKAGRQEQRNSIRLARKIQELRAKGVRGQNLYQLAAKELGLRGGWEAVRDAYYRIPKIIREMIIREREKEEEEDCEDLIKSFESGLRRILPR